MTGNLHLQRAGEDEPVRWSKTFSFGTEVNEDRWRRGYRKVNFVVLGFNNA